MAAIRSLRSLASQVVADEIIRDPVPYVQHMGLFRSTPFSRSVVRMTSVYGYVLPSGYQWKLIHSAGYYAGISASHILIIKPYLESETITYPGYHILSVVPDASQELMCVVLENYKGYHFNIVKRTSDGNYLKSETIHSSHGFPRVVPNINCFRVVTGSKSRCGFRIIEDKAASYSYDPVTPEQAEQHFGLETEIMRTEQDSVNYRFNVSHEEILVSHKKLYDRCSVYVEKHCVYVSTRTENVIISKSGTSNLHHQDGDYMIGPSVVRNQGNLFFITSKGRSPIRSLQSTAHGAVIILQENKVLLGRCFPDGVRVYGSDLYVENNEKATVINMGHRYHAYRNKYYISYQPIREIKDTNGIMTKLNEHDIYCDGNDTDPGQQYIINPGNGYLMDLHKILSMRLRLVEL